MEMLNSGFGGTQLLGGDLCLDTKVGQLVSKSLGFNAKALTLLLASSDLLLKHNPPLNGDVVFGLKIFERGRSVTRLTLIIVIGYLGVAQLEVKGAVCVSESGDFLLKRRLGIIGLCLCLLVFALHPS